ncbi:MAG: DnaJ domain-containing protein [Limisphaerales bacterium]
MGENQNIGQAFRALDCNVECSEEDVKVSYRQLVKVWHPDRFASDPQLVIKATERMKVLNDAYQTLQNHFAQKQLQAGYPNRAGSPEADAKTSTSRVLSETVVITELRDSDSALVYCKNVTTKSRCSEDRWETTEIRVYKTVPTHAGESFEAASRRSMSFFRDANSGYRTKHMDIVGGGTGNEYVFDDGSRAAVYSSSEDTWSEEKTALRGKFSNDLLRLHEAFVFFERNDDWASCLEIAQRAVELHSNHLWSWISRGVALRKLGRSRDAYLALKPAAHRSFTQTSSDIWLFGPAFGYELDSFAACYILACYAAHCGATEESKQWLKTLFEMAESAGRNSCQFEQYRSLALKESDLHSVRSSIPDLPPSWKFFNWLWR